jgi:hypothetical protein
MQPHPVSCGRNDVSRFPPAVSSATRLEVTNRGKYVTRITRERDLFSDSSIVTKIRTKDSACQM